MVSPLPKTRLIFTNLGQGLSQKVGGFKIFAPISRAKCWVFEARNPPLSLFLAFWPLYFTICTNNYMFLGQFGINSPS